METVKAEACRAESNPSSLFDDSPLLFEINETVYAASGQMKYRKPVLNEEPPKRVRDLIREIQGHVSQDHVQLPVSIPP
jgi:hypothetical protein